MITSVTDILVEIFCFEIKFAIRVCKLASLNRRDWQRRICSRASEHLLLYTARDAEEVTRFSCSLVGLVIAHRRVFQWEERRMRKSDAFTRPRIAKTHAYVTVRMTRASIGRLRYT